MDTIYFLVVTLLFFSYPSTPTYNGRLLNGKSQQVDLFFCNIIFKCRRIG